MPPLTADDTSSPLIAYLIIIPIAILFAGIGISLSCSEKWNKSNSKVKRFLQRKKNIRTKPSRSTIKTEDTTKSEEDYCEPTLPPPSVTSITIPHPLVRSDSDNPAQNFADTFQNNRQA
jgi:hypothetical protein